MRRHVSSQQHLLLSSHITHDSHLRCQDGPCPSGRLESPELLSSEPQVDKERCSDQI